MGIYIKGMEMPKGCGTCPYCDRAWNNPKCKAKSVQGRFLEHKMNLSRTRQKWCPLVSVPPHGDLIDQDEYRDEFMNGVYALCSDDSDNYRANAIIDLFDAAPTIIPASEDGDGDGKDNG